MRSTTRSRTAIAYLTYLLLHVGFDAAARLFEVTPGISLWYPTVGLAYALIILVGLRAVPVALLACLYTGVVGRAATGHSLYLILPFLTTGVYLAAGWLVHRRFGPKPRPTQPLETAGLIAVTLSAPIVAASLGATLIWAAGIVSSHEILPAAFNWWVGDLAGVVTVAPLCLVHFAPWVLGESIRTRPPRTWRASAEIVLQLVLLLGCVWPAMATTAIRDFHGYYLCFVPLIWVCLRHGFPGATVATCLLTMCSLAAVNYYGGSEHVIADLFLFMVSVTAVGLGLGWSVSCRKFAENERERLLAILEATSDFVGTCDLDGRIEHQNSSLLKLRGFTDVGQVRGRQVAEIFPAWAAQKRLTEGIPAALRDGIWQGELALLNAAGQEIPVSQVLLAHRDAKNQPPQISMIARDISAQKRAEQGRLESERNQLQAQKLESLGVLAGGIAHDFNNLLTVMLGNATLARLDLPAESPAERSIHQIELAAFRAAELCRQMLNYSGKGQVTSELVNLGAIVEETTGLLKISISKKCSLQFEIAPELPPVMGDPTQLNQITMNLVMNASDACGERGGRIVVRTGCMRADRAYLHATYLAPDLEPGLYVFLEVSDDGCGMSAAVLSRIFEPFYSTKFSGHGLGLSAVLGIARSHQGAVKVDSQPGQGSTFRLLLPAAVGVAPPVTPGEPPATPWRRSGCILVVDDEEPVRAIASRILEHHGFTTVVAADGRQAVEIFGRESQRFDAVLLDLSMPVMDGKEALREFRRLNPAVPVVLMSGYNRIDSAGRFPTEGLAGFLQKPFESSGLVEAIFATMDRDRDAN